MRGEDEVEGGSKWISNSMKRIELKGEWRGWLGGDDARSRMLNRSRQRRRSRLKEEKTRFGFPVVV